MRLVFLGTPAFAAPSLEALAAAGHEILAVYTQPDRPKGRGQELAASPVKEAARRLGLPVRQPERVRRPEVVEELRALAPEIMIVVGYGQIIPKAILDIPPRGILNVHASLLPKYRGAAPIQWAIANGERTTGVTIMKIDEGLDTGDMLLKSETAIGERETAPQLAERLAVDGARLLCEALERLDTIVPEKQDGGAATLAPILKKEDGEVDWRWRADKIACRMRGFEPWPGCYSYFRGQRLQIRDAEAASGSAAEPGTLLSEGRYAYVACGEGTMLRLKEVQLEGKKRITGEAFRNGYPFRDNEVLGEKAS